MSDDQQKTTPQQGAAKSNEANAVERRAPGAPSTAYEYENGDRGENATAHEQQLRDALSGPSRDDVAATKPKNANG